jgi:hypothetical protein
MRTETLGPFRSKYPGSCRGLSRRTAGSLALDDVISARFIIPERGFGGSRKISKLSAVPVTAFLPFRLPSCEPLLRDALCRLILAEARTGPVAAVERRPRFGFGASSSSSLRS